MSAAAGLGATIGFSTACLANHSIAGAARAGREMGFRAIELLAFDGYRHSQGDLAGFYFDQMDARGRQALRKVARQFERVAIHAPFIDIALFAPNPGVREEAFRQVAVAIEATAFLAGETTTVHVTPKMGFALEEYWDEILDVLGRLGDRAAEAGVTLTIETGYPVGVESFARLIWEMDHRSVGANIDVGHLTAYLPAGLPAEEVASAYNDLLLAQCEVLDQKVFHFHVHDVRPGDLRDHRAVGRGFLDFARLMRWCVQHRYEGMLVLELEESDPLNALRESKQTLERAWAQARHNATLC